MTLDLINYDNAVFRNYAFWMAVLVIKTLVMAPLTGRQRFKSKVFANAEDAKRAGGSVKFDNDDVERVRSYSKSKLFELFKPKETLKWLKLNNFGNEPNIEIEFFDKVSDAKLMTIIKIRAHQNDLENILPFAIIGFLYVFTQPSELLASLLFKVTGISRIVHTVLYLRSSPSRGIAFIVPLAISLYMAFAVLCYFF